MKNLIKYSGIALMMAMGFQAQAQDVDVLVVEDEKSTFWDRELPNFRYPDQRGLTTFEPTKDIVEDEFEGVQVRLGGAFALQFQGIDHENASGSPELYELGKDFNLATANMTFDILLAKGVRVNLTTYLSSLHHPEAYVKGGYLQIDNLDFISDGLLSGLMDHVRVKIGHMENNYGDAHFRRTDNAQALYNPFVGNYLMDSFTTEVGAEVYYFNGPWLAMVGFTNSNLNQSTIKEDTDPSYLAKLGYDNQVSDNFRFRLTGSVFHSPQRQMGQYGSNQYLYSGDRAGTRYYNVMMGEQEGYRGYGSDFRAGRVNPNFGQELTSFMINPFIKVGGLEFFGIYENASGEDEEWNQYAGELIYRFGQAENFYIGGRYNNANNDDLSVNRYNIGAGWFMTKNILTKVEYVNQEYNDYPASSHLHEGQFDGFNVEAVISF